MFRALKLSNQENFRALKASGESNPSHASDRYKGYWARADSPHPQSEDPAGGVDHDLDAEDDVNMTLCLVREHHLCCPQVRWWERDRCEQCHQVKDHECVPYVCERYKWLSYNVYSSRVRANQKKLVFQHLLSGLAGCFFFSGFLESLFPVRSLYLRANQQK